MNNTPLKIQLAASLVDSPYPRKSQAHISLKNSTGRLSIEHIANDAADVYLFTVQNPLDVGYSIQLNLAEEVRDLLCLAVSLSSKYIIFSKNIVFSLLFEIPDIITNNNVLFTETASVGVMTRLLELDEDQIFEAAKELLMFKFRQPYGRSLEDYDLYDSIQAYLDAADNHVAFTRRRHLWRSLEKAANAGKSKTEELKGDALDQKIANLTAIAQDEAEKFREFENRTKHVLNSMENMTAYMDFLEQEAMLTAQLKEAVDKVIITKLRQRRAAIANQPSSTPSNSIVRRAR